MGDEPHSIEQRADGGPQCDARELPHAEACHIRRKVPWVPQPPGIRTEPMKPDVDEIAAVVRNASRLADKVTVQCQTASGRRCDADRKPASWSW